MEPVTEFSGVSLITRVNKKKDNSGIWHFAVVQFLGGSVDIIVDPEIVHQINAENERLPGVLWDVTISLRFRVVGKVETSYTSSFFETAGLAKFVKQKPSIPDRPISDRAIERSKS